MSDKTKKTAKSQGQKFNVKLFLSLFLPYLLLILIIGAINFFLVFRAMDALRAEAVKTGQEKSESIQNQIAIELYNNLPALAALENSYQVKQLSEADPANVPDFTMVSYYFQREMVKKLTNANYLAVYLPEKDYLVTTQNGYDQYTIDLFLQQTGITREILDSFLDRKYSMRYINPQHSWITSRNTMEDSKQILMIADYNLLSVIRGCLGQDDIYALAVDEKVVQSNSPLLRERSYEELFDQEKHTLKSGEHEYVLVPSELPFSELELTVGIQMGSLSGELREFRRLTMILLGVALVLALAWTFFRTGRMYRPMNALAQLSSQKGDKGTAVGTLEKAGMRIRSLNSENYRIQQEAAETAPVMIGRMLRRLVETKDNGNSPLAREILKICEMDADKGFAVFGIGILEDENGIFSETDQDTRFGRSGMEYFFLNNFMQDLLLKNHSGKMSIQDGYYLVLVQGDAAGDIEEANASLEELCRQYMQCTVITTKAYRGAGPDELAECVDLAHKAIVHDLFWGRQDEWMELSERSSNTYIESVRNLVNSLSTRKYDEAEQILDDIITTQLPRDENDVRKAIYRMYGTIGIITAVIESQTGSHWESVADIDYGSRLYRVRNVKDFREESKRILSELISFREQYQKNVIPDIVVEAKDYVDAHYTESGLNVAAVADALDISDSYLTRMFRTYMECNVLEYIQRKRVDKAKELLRTESVKEAAANVGLWDTQAMIRLFRKYVGMTPGAYKEQLAEEEKRRNAAGDGT